MAPRKTKTTAADPVREEAGLDKGAPEVENTVTLNIEGLAKDAFNLELRFQVALAMLPAVYPYIGDADHLDDENRAGACARIAFEFADAFIAQSKKGQGDGEG